MEAEVSFELSFFFLNHKFGNTKCNLLLLVSYPEIYYMFLLYLTPNQFSQPYLKCLFIKPEIS